MGGGEAECLWRVRKEEEEEEKEWVGCSWRETSSAEFGSKSGTSLPKKNIPILACTNSTAKLSRICKRITHYFISEYFFLCVIVFST